eukprot:SAG11_NODE_9078_length_946_cov_1.733176_1_plen_54_part_00
MVGDNPQDYDPAQNLAFLCAFVMNPTFPHYVPAPGGHGPSWQGGLAASASCDL